MGHPLSLEDRIASLNWAPIPVSRILAAFAVTALALAGALGFFNANSGFAGDALFVVAALLPFDVCPVTMTCHDFSV